MILGGGHGGVQAAASLRDEGFEGEIILVNDENELPYHKPPLSKAFLKSAEERPQLLRGESFYSSNRIEPRFGSRVEAIDAIAKRLHFANGTHLGFGTLIIATGARPRAATLPGSTLNGVMMLRTLSDSRAIRDAATKAEHVVIIGGGFIGLELAATLSEKGKEVTVVEAQDRLLSRVVANPISDHVRRRLEDIGIKVLAHTTVSSLEGNDRVRAAVTSDGLRLPAELVIVGIGALPNIELAANAGLSVKNGIVVDGLMRSSIPSILAIGDCANYRHWQTGEYVRLESVQNATDHGRLAARTIMGKGGDYNAVPWFWSDIGDTKLQIVGLANRSNRKMLVGEPAENRFSVYEFMADQLVAIESVNRPSDHMLGRRMIAAGFSPTPEKVEGGPEAIKSAFAEWQKERATVV